VARTLSRAEASPATAQGTPGRRKAAARPRRINPEARRRAILEAALAEFAERGYAAARLDDVAARAGVAKGTLYLYFAHKEALFEQLIRSAVSPLIDRFAGLAAAADLSALEALDKFFDLFRTEVLGTDRKLLLRLIIAEGARFPAIAEFYYREVVAHGLTQAFQKRGLPRGSLSDNGPAMIAVEIVDGLTRLGVLQQTTLPYTPEANAKIEILWASVEGRLMAMLEHVSDLSLAKLNEATLAWVEHEYNRKVNSETGQTPIARFLAGPSVMRPCPDSAALRLAFSRTERRMQRRSDGTLVIGGRRFEVPDRYRHLRELEVRYAGWDLSHVHLVDERSGNVLCRLLPQNKLQNASGLRRTRDPDTKEPPAAPPDTDIPPLLKKLMNEQSDSGLPPAYLPKDERPRDERSDDEGDAP